MLGLLGVLAVTVAAPDAGAPLIPRAVVLGNPGFAAPVLAPDGTRIAFLKPDERGVVQLYVRTIGASDDTAITREPRSLRSVRWTEDGTGLFFHQDVDGDERHHLHVVDVASKNVRDLTPFPQASNALLETSPKAPDWVMVSTNRRDAKAFDVIRVNWKTGAIEADTQNPGDVAQWIVDADFRVRAARALLSNGGTELRVRDTVKTPWRPIITASLEETIRPFGFTLDGKSLILASTVSSDTERVIEKSIKTGTERLLASNPKSDVVATTWNRVGSGLRAVAFEGSGRREWTSLDWIYGIESERLKTVSPGEFEVISTDKTDVRWVVSFSSEGTPPLYVLWDRKAQQATPLGSAFPKLDGLAPVKPVTITARDGLELQGFLTQQAGSRSPLVLLVHDGPRLKDQLAFDPTAQWLANRGAAVLQVNYRGSAGYGKRFANAGNRQWGLAMQDDLSDAVAWAIKEGIADGARVAIVGTGYGGYATLMGLAKTPELYACGVDFAGPTNLLTSLSQLPTWWKPQEPLLWRRIANPKDPKDKELLTAASPFFSAERITAPLLIAHGENDVRVKISEPEQLVAALRGAKRTVGFVVYGGEGHSLAKLENRLDLAARTERFLAKCLGLRLEESSVKGGSAVER